MTAFENFSFFLARNLRSRGFVRSWNRCSTTRNNKTNKTFDKETNEEILFNGEKRSFSSEQEAYANLKALSDEEVKQLPEYKSIEESIIRSTKESPEYKDLQYQRMRNADNPNVRFRFN